MIKIADERYYAPLTLVPQGQKLCTMVERWSELNNLQCNSLPHGLPLWRIRDKDFINGKKRLLQLVSFLAVEPYFSLMPSVAFHHNVNEVRVPIDYIKPPWRFRAQEVMLRGTWDAQKLYARLNSTWSDAGLPISQNVQFMVVGADIMEDV